MKNRKFIIFLLSALLVLSFAGQSFAQGGPPTDPDPDGDGLPNSVDQCDTQAGPRINNGCPETRPNPTRDPADIPPDSDGDGTADPLDRCPNEAGDGANGGCPVGTTTDSQAQDPNPVLDLAAAPPDGECVVSTEDANPVNIRAYATTNSDIVGVIVPNEWVEVLGIFVYPPNLYAESVHEYPEPPLNILPIAADPDYDRWLLVQDSNTDAVGWVAEAVVRYGGICGIFDITARGRGGNNNNQVYLVVKMQDVLISSYSISPTEEPEAAGGVFVAAGDVNGDGNSDGVIFPGNMGLIFIPTVPPEAGFDYYLKIDGVDGESSGDTVPTDQFSFNYARVDLVEEGCELVENSDGTITSTCDDGGQLPSITVCTYQQVHEAGVYEEVCYEIEIPEGCVVDSSEAGVWHVTCEDDGDGVDITPLGETEPILTLDWDDDTVGIALLLPAVQKVREAANR